MRRTPRHARGRVAGSRSERSGSPLRRRATDQTPRARGKSRAGRDFFSRLLGRDYAPVPSVGLLVGDLPEVRAAWLVLRPLLAAGDDGLGALATDTRPTGGAAPAALFASGLDGLAINQQLEQLILQHGEAVYRVALSVVRDPMTAEDVAQEALLKAWQALPGYRGEAPLRSWLLRITHNTAVSWLRKRREDVIDPQLMPEHAPSDSTEHAVERRAALAAFERALAGLDELSRSIIVLRELEGMAYEDIAAMLEVPLPTVKTRLLRARRLLSTSLEGWRP